MPRGRGWGCRRRRQVISFLEPCLLVLLRSDQAHGYSLLNDLSRFGFDPAFIDPSLVYRVLREMEATGLVVSEWVEESLGPQRRVYRVTQAGEEYLAQWTADLRHTRQQINDLLAAYEATPRPEDKGSART